MADIEVHDGAIPPRVNLRAKLLMVMGDVFGVAKRGQNTQGGTYSYQKAADIFPKVQRALREHGVTFIAHELSTEWPPPHTSGAGKPVFVCVVKMQYRFHDTESDEVLSGDSSGLAFDSSDKGLNKAKTAALKYFLKQTLLLAEEDDDSEIETIEPANRGKLAVKRDQPTNHADMIQADDDIPWDENIEATFQASTDPKITPEHHQEILHFCSLANIDFWLVYGKSFIGLSRLEGMTEHQYDIWRNLKTVMLDDYRKRTNATQGGSGSKDIDAADRIVNETAHRISKQAHNNPDGISEGKQGRIFALAMSGREKTKEEGRGIVQAVLQQFDLTHESEIPWKGKTYERFCHEIKKAAQ